MQTMGQYLGFLSRKPHDRNPVNDTKSRTGAMDKAEHIEDSPQKSTYSSFSKSKQTMEQYLGYLGGKYYGRKTENDKESRTTDNAGTKDVSVQTEDFGKKELLKETDSKDVSGEKTDNGKDEIPEKTGSEKLLQDIRKLWLSGENSDVLVKVKDKEFQAHRVFLAARSPVLRAMFQNDTIEKATGEVIIDDCDPAVFEQLLHYIYTGAPRELKAENACALYVVADKYLMNEVKALCVQRMKDILCLFNFCDILNLALMHKEEELLEVAVDFLSKHMADVMKTVGWQMFLIEHATWGNEILIRALELQNRK